MKSDEIYRSVKYIETRMRSLLSIMSFSACLKQEGYVLIPRDSIFDRLQFARHQPIVYSIIRSMYNQFLSGGVRLIQTVSDVELDDPFVRDIARGVEDWMWEALVQILMLGVCVCSVFEGHTRTIEEYQIEQLQKARKKKGANEQEIDEVLEVLIRKAQDNNGYQPPKKKQKRGVDDEEGEEEEEDTLGPEQDKANYYISRVMNIEELDVYVHMDIYNKTDYKFIYKNYQGSALVELEILDLYVLEYEKPTVLDRQVQLNSVYNRIIQDYQLKEHNLLCHAQGSILSSNPMILLQDNPVKKDQDIAAADSIRDVFNTHVSSLISASSSSSSGGGDPGKVVSTKAVHPGYGYEVMQAEQHMMEVRIEERVTRPQVILTPSVGAETQLGYLPYNRILAKQNMPIPVPYFNECNQMFQSQIYTALCVPFGIQTDINPSSTVSSSQSMGKSGSIGQDGTSNKSTSYELYNNTLRFIRNFLVREIQVILDLKTEASRTQMAKKISDTWNAKKSNRDKTPVQFDPGNLKISIEVPGLRSSDDVWALYKIDKLEESAFDGHFINNGFHARDLKPKAGLNVKEMNGIKINEESKSKTG